MSTIVEQAVPAGTWQADPVHSSVGFAVKHLGVGTFKGSFDTFAATLADGKLSGEATVASIRVQDENLTGHLLSPDFFDAERFPTVRFESSTLRVEGAQFVAEGELELKGVRKPIKLQGTISGPSTDPYGNERYGLSLSTVVDRTAFGLNWNAPLPGGGFALANDVTLKAELSLVKAA